MLERGPGPRRFAVTWMVIDRRRTSPIAPHGAVGAALLTLRENPSVRRPFLNTFGTHIAAPTAVALIGQMPGLPRRRRQASLSAEASSMACSHGSEQPQGLLVAGGGFDLCIHHPLRLPIVTASLTRCVR